jgi:hypothetical protein
VIHRKVARRASVAAFVAFLACASLGWTPASAHEIPADVTIQVFFKPEDSRLRLALRVPLAAMRDIDYPKRNGLINSESLDLARADKTLRDAATLWIADFLHVYENGAALTYPTVREVRASLQGDRSFASYDEAIVHLSGPRLADDTEFLWSQGLLDVLFEYPIQSDRSRFAIDPRFGRLGIRTVTVLRFLPPGGAIRAFELDGSPGLVQLDPQWYQAAFRFVALGFEHILDGTDHLLFLFCLVIPFRRIRALVAVVTSFTVAHSITLIASAYNIAPDALWFPPLIETLIATSIVYMALENIVGASARGTHGEGSSGLSASVAFKHRWLITFGFGLVHGFGFSFALRRTLQFAGSHLLTSLLSFNIGVELGQLLVLVLLIPALDLLFRYVVEERIGTIILSATVAHTAWHWMTERWGVLRQFRFEWPAFDLAFWAAAMRWGMAIVALGGLWWLWGLRKSQVVRHKSQVEES